VKLSLTESDNTASLALYRETKDKLSQDKQAISFLDLEVSYESANDREDYVYISSKSYSSVLKCLYLSCFNNFNSSNEILQFLTESKNRDRLASGLPKDLPVANKIGVFQNKVQSDCAIVYEPKRPYMMCLMFFTDGKATDVNQHFKNVAELTQNYIREIKL
jgi:beta-lactamase class A